MARHITGPATTTVALITALAMALITAVGAQAFIMVADGAAGMVAAGTAAAAFMAAAVTAVAVTAVAAIARRGSPRWCIEAAPAVIAGAFSFGCLDGLFSQAQPYRPRGAMVDRPWAR